MKEISWFIALLIVIIVMGGLADIFGSRSEEPPPEPTRLELQRQNRALRDSLAQSRGWDSVPPGWMRRICEEVESE